jgi:hypothetical protein
LGGGDSVKYVGLTDNPDTRKIEHSSPSDWWQRKFDTENQARQWEKEMLEKPGYTGGPGGSGWKYGYTYTITNSTKQ